jgi:elongation factor 1 alpha-like protein
MMVRIVKSSDKSSASMPEASKVTWMEELTLQPGCKISDGSRASISKGRPGVDEGNHKKNGLVGTQSSEENWIAHIFIDAKRRR